MYYQILTDSTPALGFRSVVINCAKCVFYLFLQIQNATLAIDQLQDHLRESSVEKASKTELLDLLDYHSSFTQEVEQKLSSLGLLKQHALNMFQDVEMEPSSQEELPVMQEIKAMQDRCHK